MSITLAAPRRTLDSLQFAIADWWTKAKTGLSIEEIEKLDEAIRRYMRADLPNRPVLRCARHNRSVEFRPIELSHRQSRLNVTALEYCQGGELKDCHTGLPHDFTVTRGIWNDIREVPIN